jgi:phage-related protein
VLKELGHELRRPEADYLRDGTYELRAKHSGTNYRILYFFHERTAVALSHGIMKQAAEVPPKEIELATRGKRRFAANPEERTYEGNS